MPLFGPLNADWIDQRQRGRAPAAMFGYDPNYSGAGEFAYQPMSPAVPPTTAAVEIPATPPQLPFNLPSIGAQTTKRSQLFGPLGNFPMLR